jgi:hypothetical protein
MQEVHVKRSIPPILILLGLAAGCASSDEAVTRSALQTPPPAANEVQRTTTSMTVGEVLAKGGRQLSPTEVKSLLTNAVMEGGTATAWREMSFPDGKVTGQSRMGDGLVIDYQGSWWMDEQGRRCWLNDHQRSPAPACVYIFQLGSRYYASGSDASGKNAPVEERRISRPPAGGPKPAS